MTVSGLKCNLAVMSKCRTIYIITRSSLNPSPPITKCLNLTRGIGFHSRVFSSYKPTHTYLHETSLLSPSMTRSISIKPLHNIHIGLLYQCSQPYLSHSFGQSNFSRTYSTENQDREPEKKLTLFARFKQMYRDYWYVLVPVHAVTSLAWFGGFYYLLKSGVDVVGILESYQVSERIISPLRDSSAGYLAVSYAMYKILTPIRYTVTLGGTTLSINYLKRWGYIRPMPSREKLQEMYQERRDNLKERRASIMHSSGTTVPVAGHPFAAKLHVNTVFQTGIQVRGTKDGIRERKDNIIKSVKVTTKELKAQTDILKEKTVKNSREGEK